MKYVALEWFLYAEAIFNNLRVRSDIVYANHILVALNADDVRAISDLIGIFLNYDYIKEHLITTYIIPQTTVSVFMIVLVIKYIVVILHALSYWKTDV